MSVVWLLVGVAAALLVAYLATCAYLYRRLCVPAKREPLDDFLFTPWEFQADYEEIDLVTADGVAFGAWFLRQPGSAQTVVISPGHKGERQGSLGVAIALWRKGFNVILYSYRSMPGSDVAPITMGVKEVMELQAVLAFARSHVPQARIGLLGFSMGAVVSMLAAAGEPSIEALVLDSPFSDLDRLIRDNVRRRLPMPGAALTRGAFLWARLRTGVRLSDSSPEGVLAALEPRPLFFIHGGSDDLTPVSHSRRLYDRYRGPREIWIVQGAPHTGAYFADRELYVERVAGFFGRHLGLNRSGQLRLVDDEEADVS